MLVGQLAHFELLMTVFPMILCSVNIEKLTFVILSRGWDSP